MIDKPQALKRKYSLSCSSDFHHGTDSCASSVVNGHAGSDSSALGSSRSSTTGILNNGQQHDHVFDPSGNNLRRKRFKPSISSDKRYKPGHIHGSNTQQQQQHHQNMDFDSISSCAGTRKNSYLSDFNDETHSKVTVTGAGTTNGNLESLLHGADHLCDLPHVSSGKPAINLFDNIATTSCLKNNESSINNATFNGDGSTCHSRNILSSLHVDSTMDLSQSAWRSTLTATTFNTTDDQLRMSSFASPREHHHSPATGLDSGVNRGRNGISSMGDRSVSPRRQNSNDKLNDLFLNDLEDVISVKRQKMTADQQGRHDTSNNNNNKQQQQNQNQSPRGKQRASAHSHLTSSSSERSRGPKAAAEDEDESRSMSDTQSMGGDSTFFNIDLPDFENGSNDSFGFSSAGERSGLGSDLNVNFEDLLNSSGFDSYPDLMSQSDNDDDDEDFTERENYIEEAREIAQKFNGECLDTNCFDKKDSLTFRCCFGHEWSSERVLLNGEWCPKCAKEFQKAKDYAQDHNGVLISQFRAKSLVFQCGLGHQWSVKAQRYQAQKRWCSKCSRMERKQQKEKHRQREAEQRRRQAAKQQELFREARSRYMNYMNSHPKPNSSSSYGTSGSFANSSSDSKPSSSSSNFSSNAGSNFGNGSSRNRGGNNSNFGPNSATRINAGGKMPMDQSMIRNMIEQHIQRRSQQQAQEFIQRRDVDANISMEQAFAVYRVLNTTVEYLRSRFATMNKAEAAKYYRANALLVHPDKNGHPKASEAFQRLQSTWAKAK
eukprot:CAMPEP_0115019552 /NCGR_PEP_ID=MMETSP0216-20121206/29523_1 /TAXON_ID=223996 /ORGANISM="Protocruzia adherens, Strain Boccale" /LENGTH=772 /DNA_ID=CAMNT_0002391067 /DNA_START=353 /DNA_END=2671 /DNA_ORIENTATION=+